MNTDTLVLLLIFQNIYYHFWMTTFMKNVNNFQRAKVQRKVLLIICLIFWQLQTDVAYQSVTYKRSV